MNINSFLKKLKKHGLENKIPNISETNAKFLRDLIKIQKTKNMLEIGTANGYSAINFALELKKIGGRLTTIELSKHLYDQAILNFKRAGVLEVINAINGNALDVAPLLKETYDFIFIDAAKRKTKDFLELVRDKVEENGIVIVDDVIKFKEKMVGLWKYLKSNKIDYNIIPIDVEDGILMIVK